MVYFSFYMRLSEEKLNIVKGMDNPTVDSLMKELDLTEKGARAYLEKAGMLNGVEKVSKVKEKVSVSKKYYKKEGNGKLTKLDIISDNGRVVIFK